MDWKTSPWLYATIELIIFFLVGLGIWKLSNTENLLVVFASLSFIFIIHRLVSTFEFRQIFSQKMRNFETALANFEAVLRSNETNLTSIGEIVDLTQDQLPEKIRGLSTRYLKVTEPKLGLYKDNVLDEAICALQELDRTMTTPVLQEVEFYKWLYHEFEQATSSTTFEIVSMDEDLEWQDSEEEREFLEKNLQAAKSGAKIDRIFVFDNNRLENAKENKAIFLHRKAERNGLNGFFVNKADFRKKGGNALRRAGQGFIIVDRKRVIIDKFQDNEARGYVTFDPAKVARYIDTYELFEVSARPLIF